MLAKKLHILEHTGESLGLLFIGNNNTHWNEIFGKKGLSYLIINSRGRTCIF